MSNPSTHPLTTSLNEAAITYEELTDHISQIIKDSTNPNHSIGSICESLADTIGQILTDLYEVRPVPHPQPEETPTFQHPLHPNLYFTIEPREGEEGPPSEASGIRLCLWHYEEQNGTTLLRSALSEDNVPAGWAALFRAMSEWSKHQFSVARTA